jgi:hypothetical protein
MTFRKSPKDYDWDGLQDRMLRTGELPKLNERSDALSRNLGMLEGCKRCRRRTEQPGITDCRTA